MTGLPITFAVREHTVLVVGGGQRALPKIKRLDAAGARINLVAPGIVPAVADLLSDAVEWVPRAFEPGDAAGAILIFGATGVDEVDRAVAAAAREAGVPVNIVDRPDLCDFTMPAVIDRDPVMVAVSTGSAAPLLARQIRRRIEAALPAKIGNLARFAEKFRAAVRRMVPDHLIRRRLWEHVLDGPVASAVLRGDESAAGQAMLTLINSPSAQGDPSGSVAIVGAGPGDPELLTLRALHFLEQADVIIYDRLVGPAVLDMARRDALFIPVGKQRGLHSVPQERINQLMAQHAEMGQRVVRLKGGDPMIFGRGGEERDYLLQRNIAVDVVPGITAAAGCAAAVGIPLTHRDYASGLTLISGEAKDGPADADWAELARTDRTIGIYMGVGRSGHIAERLMAHGRAPTTPVAIIENGTLPEQRFLLATLGTLAEEMAKHDVVAPAFVVIGDVAALADTGATQAEDAHAVMAIAAE